MSRPSSDSDTLSEKELESDPSESENWNGNNPIPDPWNGLETCAWQLKNRQQITHTHTHSHTHRYTDLRDKLVQDLLLPVELLSRERRRDRSDPFLAQQELGLGLIVLNDRGSGGSLNDAQSRSELRRLALPVRPGTWGWRRGSMAEGGRDPGMEGGIGGGDGGPREGVSSEEGLSAVWVSWPPGWPESGGDLYRKGGIYRGREREGGREVEGRRGR